MFEYCGEIEDQAGGSVAAGRTSLTEQALTNNKRSIFRTVMSSVIQNPDPRFIILLSITSGTGNF